SGGSAARRTFCGRSSTTGFTQQFHQASQGLRAVAQAVLVVGVELRGRLAKLGEVEERVIAEAVLAARSAGDLPVPEAFGDKRQRIVGMAQQHHYAGVVGATVLRQAGEQL